MRNAPAYVVKSVDHALRLLELLCEHESLGISEAATYLGVAKSTAHRLLATLIYRQFVEQTEDRRYQLGPAMRLGSSVPAEALALQRAAAPWMKTLVAAVNETSHLGVRVGTDLLLFESFECTHALRVGNRSGALVPAHQAAGGKAVLATMTRDEIVALYRDRPDIDETRLFRKLATVRKNGYAINDETHRGYMSIAMAIDRPHTKGSAIGAVTVALPIFRFRPARLSIILGEIASASARITADFGALSG